MRYNEFQPKGYVNWTQYYFTKQARRKALKENLMVVVIVTALFSAYCLMGGIECL